MCCKTIPTEVLVNVNFGVFEIGGYLKDDRNVWAFFNPLPLSSKNAPIGKMELLEKRE